MGYPRGFADQSGKRSRYINRQYSNVSYESHACLELKSAQLEASDATNLCPVSPHGPGQLSPA